MPSASLRTKIYLGFSFLVGLLVLNGLVSYFGLQQLRDAIARKQRIQDTTTSILTLDRDVQELSLRVDRYVTSGQESLRNGVGLLHERMKAHLDVAEDQSIDPTVQELFAQIGTALDAYRTQFDQVVIERRVREDLVQTQMPTLAAQVRSELESLSSIVTQDAGPSPSALALTECQALFTESERSFLKYFATPSTREVNSAASSLAAARRRLNEVASTEETAVAQTLIRDYERIGLRAVQATRGYLYFRNVVMAGEASEIAYYSESLRKLAVSRSSEIAAEVTATRERVNRTAIAVVVAAVLLGAYIAWRLASLVLPPVLALTRAFNRLSDGETLEEIPAADRHDEIGQMARAARVFSDRNRQTRELLEHSEELSSDLKRQAAVLEETNQELDNFAYVASHDLKSPLRGIRQLASWIEEDAADSLPDDSKTHLSQMQTRVGKMEQLLDDLLAYSRIGRQTPHAEAVDLGAVIADIVDITDNPHRVSVTYPEKLPTIVTDRVPLEQVLRNLIGNAIKYNDREEKGCVTIDLEMESDSCRIGIADNGPGIAKKDQERAFQMYQRVNSTSTDGTGMGLAIVKKQVEQQGGSIQLSSELGEGARFEFTWPVLSE